MAQNLHEIDFQDFRSAKYAILPYLEALSFEFDEVLQFLRAEIFKKLKFRASKTEKWHF